MAKVRTAKVATAKILDGKSLSQVLAAKLARNISRLLTKPKLVIVQIGDLAESNTYIRNKKLFAEKIGALVEHKKYNEAVSQKQVISDIVGFNKNPSVHGIIVQLPIPSHFDTNMIIESIDPNKDVDGLTSKNKKLLLENKAILVPATTKGVLTLLDHYKIPLVSKKVVMVGRSLLVGRPTALAMLNRNATVTICHKHTKRLAEETKRADIVVVATGHPKLIRTTHVSKGQTIIDIGITIVGTNKKTGRSMIEGDVDFKKVAPIVRAITPVPGGVGPMTIVSLFENLLIAYNLSSRA